VELNIDEALDIKMPFITYYSSSGAKMARD